MNKQDMEQFARFFKIVNNYLNMKKLLTVTAIIFSLQVQAQTSNKPLVKEPEKADTLYAASLMSIYQKFSYYVTTKFSDNETAKELNRILIEMIDKEFIIWNQKKYKKP
jgi:hypothetical protein